MVAALASISAARSAAVMQAMRGSAEPGGAARWTASLIAPGAIVATLIGAAAAGVLAAASLYPAREFGLAVAVGPVLDVLLLRLPMVAILARRGRS